MKIARMNIKVSRKKRKRKHSKTSLHSKDVDEVLLPRFTVFNELSHHSIKKELFSEKGGIYYMSPKYVGLLRSNIIKLYEKSEDPVEKGDLQRSNLEFCLDFVKTMYETDDIKNREYKIISKAAFILYNLNIKHAFLDGNKRTSIVSCNSFLEYNGYSLILPSYRVSNEFVTELAKGNKSERDCRIFILKYAHRIRIHKSCRKFLKKLTETIEQSDNEKKKN